MSEDSTQGPSPASPYRYAEQLTPPPATRASEVAQTTFEHVFEVDPRLMQRHVLQQAFPNWDTLRIMNSRHDHLDWMHRHFADKVVTGSELLAEVDAEPRSDAAPASVAPSSAAPTSAAPTSAAPTSVATDGPADAR